MTSAWRFVVSWTSVLLVVALVQGGAFAAVAPDDTTTTREPRAKGESEKEKPQSGALGQFEDEATSKKSGDGTGQNDQDEDDAEEGGFGEQFAGAVFSVFSQATVYVLGYGGAVSWYRVHDPGPEGGPVPGQPEERICCRARQRGEPMLPFLAVSAAYQNVESDVNAARTRFEAGVGPVALHVDWTHYTEDSPDGELDLTTVHLLYRMTFTEQFEIDLGGGSMNISGNGGNSGGSLTTPVRLQATPVFGMTLRPVWAWINDNTITDTSMVLTGSLRFISLEGGYRWTRVGNASLDGPLMGLFFHL